MNDERVRPGHIAPARRTHGAWPTVILLSALYVFSYVDRQVLALLIEPVKSDLGIGDTQIALLIGTSFAIAYAVLSVPMGWLADRLNRKLLIVGGGLLWTITTAASAFASNFTMLMVLRIGVAVGEAALSPAALSMIADLFPRERRALPTGVYGMSGAVGATGAFVMVAAVIVIVGAGAWGLAPWRLTLLAVGLPGALLVLLFGISAREPVRAELIPSADGATVGTVLRNDRRFYIGLIPGVALMAIVNMGTLVWYPTHLIRAFGFSASEAGFWFGSAAAISAVTGTFLLLLGANALLRRGWTDAPVRVAMLAVVLGVPCIVGALLVRSAPLSLALVLVGETAMIGMANLPTLAIQLVTPNRQRGFFIATFFLFANLAGLGLGPLLATLTAETLMDGAGGAAIGRSLALVSACVAPFALGLLALARPAFAAAYERAQNGD